VESYGTARSGGQSKVPISASGSGPQRQGSEQHVSETLNSKDVHDDGRAIRDRLTFEIPGVVALSALIYWFSRPRRQEEVQDAETFAEALTTRGEDSLSNTKARARSGGS
jgi:hypothetical protein